MLLGPTASGKSAMAMALAERWPIEIVSVDSALVYRGMDIGTAKPDHAERARVPHHLIDLIEPEETYSAARFVDDADAVIASIRARGRQPLLVGGTMLYAKAFLRGLDELPPANTAIRARIMTEAADVGWHAMHARLARVDPLTARRLAPNDSQRIERALEVFELTRRPMSAFHSGACASSGARPAVTLVALEPGDRAELHRRIAERFEQMLAAGIVDELRVLRARGTLDAGMPSMRCVGYRQAWEFLEGRTNLAGFRERAIAATRQLAKRQLTWLRAMPGRLSIDPFAVGAARRVAEALEPALRGSTRRD